MSESWVKELLNDIWARSTGDYIYLPVSGRGEWHEDIGYEPWKALHVASVGYWNRFFTPLRFNGPRKNENVGEPGVLFADLDEATWEREPYPTAVWATSPGSLQAVWLLDKPMTDIEHWRALNRGITELFGADPGGWPEAKVLRIPGSYNYKREVDGVAPGGTLVYYDRKMVYRPDEIETDRPFPVFVEPPPLSLPPLSFDEGYIQAVAAGVPNSILHDMNQPATDRSALIWKMACRMKTWGILPEHAYYLLRVCRNNKYGGRSQVLWSTVLKAYQKGSV